MSGWRTIAAMLALALTAGQARAENGLHGMAQISLGGGDAEESWLDGGFGKTSWSDTDVRLLQAVVEWRPSFTFSTGAVVSLQHQAGVHPSPDLNEAYLSFKAPPMAAGRVSARAGLFYPPVSLEHEGVGWTTQDTLSASALNTWIGEEVKVGGLEATFARDVGDHELSATAAVFGWNDTSGTLLTFRGWALGETRAGSQTELPLPPLSAFMVRKQADETYPVLELDGRAGYYGRLQWRPPAPFTLEIFHYDNVGNRIAVEDLQWAWETRFTNLGLTWEPNERTRVLAQALTGETLMGFRTPEIWVDMGFRAAYVLASREVGDNTLTGRLDWFDTDDRTWIVADNNDEEGWAATAAWRRPLADHADLLVEAQRVSSNRPSRALAGDAAKQDEFVLQTALRLHF
ncbi:MAG TPA: hypothetical protein VFX95_04730 [Caulobacteraceae bacterium]|nr:hypothetical protein [Caulobacteraceae bacterium]